MARPAASEWPPAKPLKASEVAALIGCSPSRLRAAAKAGEVPGAWSRGNRWWFPRRIVAHYCATGQWVPAMEPAKEGHRGPS